MLAEHVEWALIQWAKWSVPKSKTTFFVATGASWYGRRVALTYAPGWLANYCIQATVRSTGSESMGRLIGTTVVAPALVPDLVGPAVIMTTVGIWYSTIIIGNCIQNILFPASLKSKSQSST